MVNLEQKLEEFKQKGHYAVQLLFGEDVGCDDSDIPLYERQVMVLGHPVGCLGEARRMYVGSLKDFLEFDVNTPSTIVSNPPTREQVGKPGYYVWGTENALKILTERGQI